MKSAALPLLALALGSAAPALAQEGTPARIRGVVERFDGPSLVVRTRLGEEATIALAPGFTVSAVVAKSLADIKEGDYLASTSVRGPDGVLKALEVHYIPRGAAEGQFPYDLAPESLMTNAFVAGVTGTPQGRLLQVTFKGAQAEIVVPPEAPVVAFVPGELALLKPGAAIVVNALRKPDGSLTAARATVEKDGVKPPM